MAPPCSAAVTVPGSSAAVITSTNGSSGDAGAQLAQHLEPGPVGQVDVEQHQVGPQLAGQPHRVAAGVRDADHLAARDPRDVAAVHPGDHEVVVDDEHPHHAGTVEAAAGTR